MNYDELMFQNWKIFNQNELKISKNFGQIKAALDILGDFLSQKVAQIS